ncbi:nucleolar protein 12-domain-containing protein [Rhodocollybia butyracea]|uniref:Nucleolar protein 12-domain-containing protein n=1 Tax=Rhodocollybia butyracea TaxID=206335 RepID=A0A9P5PPF0_9AGAR|nr:nucleolar protein 12-domain-containing protein [Rhodocollybia butyracea]
MSSNLNILTQSHFAIAEKKRAKRTAVKEVIFDDAARHEYLTGFHKRKVAKTEAARKKAIEREKQQRQEDRREQRRMLRERAVENAAEIEKAYGADSTSFAEDLDEWRGISESNEQKEKEYEDEEVLATVAIVEDFDPDTLLHGPTKPEASSSSLPAPAPPHRKKSSDSQPSKKPKPKKIRYQTKDARKADRTKQRARRTEKAELAGGKASRKSSKGGKRR